MARTEQYVLIDDELSSYLFENFESFVLEAMRQSTVTKMTILTMPNGDQYTMMKRPKTPAR